MNPRYLPRKQAAEFLGCSTRFLDRAKAAGEIPFHRFSRRLVVFFLRDLEEYAERFRVAVDSEREGGSQ